MFIMGKTSRCCMICLMPQPHVSGSFVYPNFNMFTRDQPTRVRKRLSAFRVVQVFYDNHETGEMAEIIIIYTTFNSEETISPYRYLEWDTL